ncbi:MAG: hypothetical protein KGJ55_00220 [Gammaproteobacteria bacterium]|nr:hypothetical protein [Gammaproteobacteria bacterium]
MYAFHTHDFNSSPRQRALALLLALTATLLMFSSVVVLAQVPQAGVGTVATTAGAVRIEAARGPAATPCTAVRDCGRPA